MHARNIKKAATQSAQDMMDYMNNHPTDRGNVGPEGDSERLAYRNEYELDMEMAAILNGELIAGQS